MSLGAVFGRAIDPSSVATQTLVESGVVVAAAAGNAGANAYITDSPAVATGAISIAAVDALPSFPSASIDLASGPDIAAINENAYPGLPVSGTLDAIGNGAGGLSLGCAQGDFAGVAGKIAVVQRGVCAFVDKGANAEGAGAIGIVVVNRDDLPPAELPTFIGYNPEIFDIPMIGTGNAAKAALLAADGTSATLNAGPGHRQPGLQEPGHLQFRRSPDGRQRGQAGRCRPGRVDHLSARRWRHPGDHELGHLDVDPECGRHRGPRRRGQPGLGPDRGQGRDHEHG